MILPSGAVAEHARPCAISLSAELEVLLVEGLDHACGPLPAMTVRLPVGINWDGRSSTRRGVLALARLGAASGVDLEEHGAVIAVEVLGHSAQAEGVDVLDFSPELLAQA